MRCKAPTKAGDRRHAREPWKDATPGEQAANLKQNRVAQRPMVLLQGPLDAVIEAVTDSGRYQSPNLWWPDDRSWCVSTEIDFRSTYVGGSQPAIRSILEDPHLESFTAALTDRIGAWSDTLNPNANPELT